MIQYSHNNRIRFGYNNGLFNKRASNADVLKFHFSSCERAPYDFQTELKETAKVIYEEAKALNRPIYLLQSGGLDSEVMIKSFKGANIPVSCISFEFPNDQNSHETRYIRKFSAEEELNTTFFKFNFLAWLRTPEARTWFHEFCVNDIIMCAHMKLMEHIWFDLNGFPVLGAGDPVIEKGEKSNWLYHKNEFLLAWFWFQHDLKVGGVGTFFQHTPEMLLSFLAEPSFAHAASGKNRIANILMSDLRQLKYSLYYRLWPNLTRRPKFVGYEGIISNVQSANARLSKERNLSFDGRWSLQYTQMLDLLAPSNMR